MSDYTPYQRGIIKRFYEHRDTLALQKLSEIVSNLYLETSEAKKKRAWKSAEAQLLAAGVHEHQVKVICEKQDLDALAKVVGEMQ